MIEECEKLRLARREDEIAARKLQSEITARKRVEYELREQKGRLEQIVEERTQALENCQARQNRISKMEALGTLAGGIAHDFNNILASITGFTELALREARPDSPMQEYLEQVGVASKRAVDLVRKILTLRHQNSEEREVVDVEFVCREALKLINQTLPQSIELSAYYRAESSHVLADASQLHQVLINLCTNAARAIDPAPGRIEVEICDYRCDDSEYMGDTLLAAGEYLRLSVIDDGCGLTDDVRERIFDPFYTTRDTDEGAGMGLALVHSIVKAHGGVIQVDSTPGQGSSFDIFLPKTVASTNPNEPDPVVERTASGRILVVDDEPMILRFYATVLQNAGFSVVTSEDGLAALQKFEADPDGFDAILSDEAMPRMDGNTLALRVHDIRPRQPILLCSGKAGVVTGIASEETGHFQKLAKPVKSRVLIERINALIDQ
jgi:signal transduction histidine kinase/CheY-like chemotaxis protein